MGFRLKLFYNENCYKIGAENLVEKVTMSEEAVTDLTAEEDLERLIGDTIVLLAVILDYMIGPHWLLQVDVSAERQKIEHFHLGDFVTTRNLPFTKRFDFEFERITVLNSTERETKYS